MTDEVKISFQEMIVVHTFRNVGSLPESDDVQSTLLAFYKGTVSEICFLLLEHL